MCVDPFAVDAKALGDFGGVHEPDSFSTRHLDELGDAPCDRLDVLGVKPAADSAVCLRASAAPVESGKMIM
jgi:hypothetical protein